ncbi:protein-glutamate methylesterase/protein-glutamine glutaminase [Pirellulaceae bacterium SH449]
MRTIRVLIVDDSTVIRRLLSDALSADPAIEIAGIAANGKIALSKIPMLNPDVITLDMEMPEMDGLTTLVEIRKLYPKLPVIMFSTLTQRGTEATMEALLKGANDYVTKPANVGSVTAAIANVTNELVPKIKQFCNWTTPATTKSIQQDGGTNAGTRLPSASSHLPSKVSRVDIVVIGVSTGGPNALSTMLPGIPAKFPVPILIVQHMPPVFTKHLADRLNQLSSLHVQEAADGDLLLPGGAWLAPGNFHMKLRRQGTQLNAVLNQEPPECSCRPAVDVLFRSAVEIFGANVLSVVMTGMGQDGLRGCVAIRQAGGRVVVQDEATSVVWGMPGAVARAGHAHKVIPLEKIADEIIAQTQSNRIPRKPEYVRN